MISFDLTQITLLLAGTFSGLTFAIALLRRKVHPLAARALIGYTFAMLVWVGWLAAWQVGAFSFLDAGFLVRVPFYGLFLLSVGYYFSDTRFFGCYPSQALLDSAGAVLVGHAGSPGWQLAAVGRSLVDEEMAGRSRVSGSY